MASGPVIVVLGATGGIGSALVRLLVKGGNVVVAGARNEAALHQLNEKHPEIHSVRVDVTNVAEVDHAVGVAQQKAGRLDGLVNCAGTFALKPLHLVKDEEFEHDLSVNLRSSFYALRAAVRAIDKERGGSVVLLSSAAARFGIPNHESIAAAKAGVVGLMLSAAATYATDNIRVNSVAPGLIETKLTTSVTSNKAIAEASAGMHPLHRFGNADQVARCIQFLLQPENDFITGQVFGVDGGLATLRAKR